MTMGTEPVPALPCCLSAAQDCDRKAPPLPQLLCAFRRPWPRVERQPGALAPVCFRQRQFPREGWETARLALCPDRSKEKMLRGEPGAGAGRSKRKCLETALLCLVALSLHMYGSWKEGPAGRGHCDHPVHPLMSRWGAQGPERGGNHPKLHSQLEMGHGWDPQSPCWGVCAGACCLSVWGS